MAVLFRRWKGKEEDRDETSCNMMSQMLGLVRCEFSFCQSASIASIARFEDVALLCLAAEFVFHYSRGFARLTLSEP
jgi:hypothetical protein